MSSVAEAVLIGRPFGPGAAPARGRERAAAYVELTKPGITRMVLVTTAVGFYLGSRGQLDAWSLAHTLVGTGLAAGGTNALNQYRERDVDARMRRTRGRPLPSGRLEPVEALRFAIAICALGLTYLALLANTAAALVVAATVASYVFVYTPLKRRTSLATVIGAVPGALPILAGWVAAGGSLTAPAWSLFWIMFLWQFPHFLALAWLYREDYRAGGLRMLTVTDPDGSQTARQIMLYALALVPVSLTPTLLGLTGAAYYVGALALGTAFFGLGLALMQRRSEVRARRLFLASVLYLPALLLLMAADKVA